MRTWDIESDLKVPKLGEKLQNIAKKIYGTTQYLPKQSAVNADPRTKVKRRLKRHPNDLPDRALTYYFYNIYYYCHILL